MKVRLAKKIMKYRSGSFLYDLMRLEGLDVSKELSKIKQYWEPRLALYYATKGGCYGRVDHRIVKAEKITARYSRKLMNCLNRLAGKNPFEIRDILGSSNKTKKNMIMKQEMQKSILKIQTAVETLTRQKVIDKNVYDFVHGEIKSLSESVENIEEVNNLDETLLTFTDKEEYVNQHINLADTSVLCKELNRRKDIGDDFFVVATEGK